MTKKHFQDFAAACAMISDEEERARAALLIASVCTKSNPRFDTRRFMDAIEELRRGECPKGFSTEKWVEARRAVLS
jgi:hypothetical protein